MSLRGLDLLPSSADRVRWKVSICREMGQGPRSTISVTSVGEQTNIQGPSVNCAGAEAPHGSAKDCCAWRADRNLGHVC